MAVCTSILRSQWNIYDGCKNSQPPLAVNNLHKKGFIVDVQLSSKYASALENFPEIFQKTYPKENYTHRRI